MAGALAVAGLAFTAAPAGAVASVTAQRIQGADRFETAANVCDAVAPTGAANVLLATGRLSFADALTASALAGDRNTCVLLTEQGSLPAATSAQLTQMKSLGTALTGVTILGGTVAVSQAVADQVTALGGITVDRIEGADRATTAANIATAVGTPGSIGGQGTVIIANGENQFNGADAMAVGPVAARGDGTNPFPILLVEDDNVPAATLTALGAAGIDNVIAVGGPTAISEATLTAAATAAGDASPTRVAGDTREDTAVAIAGLAVQQGLAATEAFIVNGRIGAFSADALVAGPLGDVRGAVTLLASCTTTLGTAATNYLDANSNRITTVTAIGGTDVIAASTLTAAETAAEDVAGDTNQTLVVTPAEAATLTVATEPSATDDRQYTVSGLTAGTTYTIQLFPSANITLTAGGLATFADAAANDGLADPGAPAADITVVNGTVVGAPGATATAAPVSGQITFTVDGSGFETVRPVVYADATGAGAGSLNLGTNDQPTEAFGVGGATSFLPAEANAGVMTADAPINGVDKTANWIVANDTGGDERYDYDENDLFYFGAVGPATQVTMAVFESQLSVGDALESTGTSYNQTPEFVSTFVLNDITPLAPTVSGSTAAPTGFTVTVDPTTITAGATVNVYVGTNNDNAFDAATDTLRASATTDADATTAGFQIPVTGLSESTAYDFFVSQTVGGEESAKTGFQDVTTTSSAPPASAPVSVSAAHVDNDLNGLLNTGDRVTITFNEAVNAAANATVTITDDDGTTGTLTNGTNATFAVGGTNNTVLTITLTGLPTGGGGTAAGVNLLGGNDNITASTGVTDRDTAAKTWVPNNTLGAGDAPLGEVTVPGSTVVVPDEVAAALASVASDDYNGTTTNFTEADLTTAEVIPGATITLTITAGTGAGATYTAVASSTGTFSIAATAVDNTSQISVTQTVTGVGTSAAITATMTS